MAIDRLVPTPRGGRDVPRPHGQEVVAAVRADLSRGSLSKRAVDLAVAGLLLVVLAPLFLVIAVAVKLDSRGPVLYRSRRVGMSGREFAMLKFRKMRRDAQGPPLTARNDERLTRMGAVLARTKLDELPQLWNVVRGDMSLVGPRPEDPRFVALDPAAFSEILRVQPGITGLSQLAFAKESHVLERPEFADRYVDRLLPAKLAIDAIYVARRSLRLDAAILAWTAAAMLLRIDVAVGRESGRLSVRRRPAAQQSEPLEQAP